MQNYITSLHEIVGRMDKQLKKVQNHLKELEEYFDQLDRIPGNTANSGKNL